MSLENEPTTDEQFLTDADLSDVKRRDKIFYGLCLLASVFGVVMLAFLILDVLWEILLGWAIGLDPVTFLTQTASSDPFSAGFLSAVVGSLWVITITVVLSLFLGVTTAIYLEEYADDTWFTRLVEANLTNLAGVPSVVYGLMVLAVFVNFGGLGPVILAGAIALALLIVPIIIVASIEALRAIPDGIRNGSYAAGATEWQTIRRVLLPQAMPGIITGTILALARAIGETAPLLMVGAVLSAGHIPGDPMARFAVMPTEIYYWAFRPVTEFHHLAAYGIGILMTILVSLMLFAFYLRNKYENNTEVTGV